MGCARLFRFALSLVGIVTVALTLYPSIARAQPPPAAAATAGGMYTVKLRASAPGVTWNIYAVDGPLDAPLARCGETGCTLRMRPGSYRLQAVGRNVSKGVNYFLVDSEEDYTLRSPSLKKKKNGLTWAVIGTIALPVSFGMMMAGVEDDDAGLTQAGLVTFIVGAIVTPTGWVKFGFNRYPRIRETSPLARVASTPGVQVGLQRMGLGAGYGIGARVSF